MPKTAKRIQIVTVRTMMDGSADTSYLGAYSNLRKSPFDIDRKHTVDCPHNTGEADATVEKLERAIAWLEQERTRLATDESDSGNWLYGSFDEAIDTLCDARREIQDSEDADYSQCAYCGGGDWTRRTLRFYNCLEDNYKGVPEDEMRKYIAQDYERMESLNDGDWWYVGIRAEAEVVIDGVVQTATSGGLWGIESDSDESYFKEIADEELSQLRAILHEMGFSKRAIATACKDVRESN
jgi:hypothetical protein